MKHNGIKRRIGWSSSKFRVHALNAVCLKPGEWTPMQDAFHQILSTSQEMVGRELQVEFHLAADNVR